MQTIDLKRFRKANNISQSELAAYLGVGQSFISQIEKGIRPFPKEYISKLTAHPKWNDSFIHDSTLSGLDSIRERRFSEPTPEHIRSVVGNIMDHNESFLVGYLERKIDDKDRLIRELEKKIGMLEAKLDLARKGEIVRNVDGSSDADAV